jgi:hypothetical protein
VTDGTTGGMAGTPETPPLRNGWEGDTPAGHTLLPIVRMTLWHRDRDGSGWAQR